MAATRRLAAIMFTDVVGFPASAQTDESAALASLREQEGIARPLFAPYGGREIKSTGDGFLVEFESALKATQCAVEIQRRLRERNAKEPRAPIHLRVGIHVGDVEERGGDIFGDAVNVASRVLPLAEPGGVCISDLVFAHVRNKISYPFEKLAQRSLKGVREPVDVYRLVLPWADRVPPLVRSSPPRLAGLPLANISPDPKDDYFADGLTEELITLLSHLHNLRVIARTSVVQYKATSKSIAQIGSELGVTSILEGTVRKAGDRLRITVQLIDVGSQEHTWATTYDRKLEDVFAVQTEVARRIAKVLKIKLRKAEETRLVERPTAHPDSYLAYLKGRLLLTSAWSEGAFREAKKQFELAISIDPTNARAHSGLSDANRYLGWGRFLSPRAEWDGPSQAHAARAIELDPGLADAHCSLAAILWDNYDFAGVEKEFKVALSLNPSCSQAHHWYANLLEDEARPEEALREFALAEESDPLSALNAAQYARLLIMLRRLDEAKAKIERLRDLERAGPTYFGMLAWYHYARGDFPRALQAADREEELTPGESWTERVWVHVASGQPEKARKILEQQERGSKKRSAWLLAMHHAVLGDLDETFRLLEKALEEHDLPLQVWRMDPPLEPARKDPRFTQFLKKVNLA